MLEIGQKVNEKYIENPFLLDEYLEFIEEITQSGTDINQLYRSNNKLRAVEIARNILSTYQDQTHLSNELLTLLQKPKSIKIAIVTEPWSIETAHILFFMKEIEKHGSGKIQVLIFLRDTSSEIVEKVIEDKSANLPKIILLDRKNEIKGFWGPRSEEAEAEYQKLLARNADKIERYREMQKWYNDNKGVAFQKEFYDVLKGIFTKL